MRCQRTKEPRILGLRSPDNEVSSIPGPEDPRNSGLEDPRNTGLEDPRTQASEDPRTRK